jgi:Protein of unknown function (DUF1236)
MKRTLLMSVAAFALAAGTTAALSQDHNGNQATGRNTPMANPAAPGKQDTHGIKQKGAQERSAPAEKQKSVQQQQPMKSKPSTTGQAQEEKASPSTTRQSQEHKSGTTARHAQENKSKQPSTTGQQTEQKSGQPPSTQHSLDTKSGTSPSTTTQHSQSPAAGATTRQGSASTTSSGGSSVSLTTEQKTKIRTTVLTSSAPRVTSVNFDVRVGTVVPRTVRVAPLPATVIEIEPQWRGYMYFVYNDEIIVVEPGSLRIVAVLLV